MPGRSVDFALKADDQATAEIDNVTQALHELLRSVDELKVKQAATVTLMSSVNASLGSTKEMFLSLRESAASLDGPMGRFEMYAAGVSELTGAVTDLFGAFTSLRAGDPTAVIGLIANQVQKELNQVAESDKKLRDVDAGIEKRTVPYGKRDLLDALAEQKRGNAEAIREANKELVLCHSLIFG